MEGILLISKEKDKTSRDMVNNLTHILNTKKIGHTGTLDPLATGILVMCIGKYTKLVDELSALKKEYIARIKVGVKTDTGDITGNILEMGSFEINESSVRNTLSNLVGDFRQTIPIYSAKKINGMKLYEYARKNIKVELPVNDVKIYEMELLEITNDEIEFRCVVSKGTYIRSVIEEICNKENIIGTMSSLCRTKQGVFNLKDSYTIEDVRNAKFKILSACEVLEYPVYYLSDDEYSRVKNGNTLIINDIGKNIILKYKEKEVAIYQKSEKNYKCKIMLNNEV